MKMNNPKLSMRLIAVCLCILPSLAACSTIITQIENRATEEPEIIPTPVSLPTQLSSQYEVGSLSCLVAEKTSIQTDENQGDLMAWRPQTDELAFVQPVNQYSGWYIGDLLIYDAGKEKESFTSKDTAIFGDLTWSPDGSAIAYVILNQQEGIYTIKTLSLADSVETDVFTDVETARTNSFSSLKGITSWNSPSDLVVTSSCGVDCEQVYDYNPFSLALNVADVIRENDNTNLIFENEFASPDGKWLISLDDKKNSWLTSTVDNQVSLIMTAIEVVEVKWSDDSKYFALRTADLVKIYQTGCSE